MKKLFLSFCLLCFYGSIHAQLNPGDIAITALNADGDDDFAFVALVDIPANTTIWFTDNEWTGTAFNNLNEGELQWSHTSIITAGTVVVIEGLGTPTATVGTISGSGYNFGASNESMFALLSQPSTSVMSTPGFLGGAANDLSGSGATLTGTGLTLGTNYIDFANDNDGFEFTGTRTGEASFSAYLPLIMNTANWQIESSNGDNIIPIDASVFTINASGPDAPQAFSATVSSGSQINLSATANADGDNVLVVFNTTNTFGTPTGTYTAGDPVTGGGTVHYIGTAGSLTNHSSLNGGTQYFYQAFSFDGADYSSALTDNATTLKAEPTNHVSSFTATANGAFQIDLTWSDNDGAVAADGFLVVGKTGAGSFASVADATAVADDSDWSDNNFALNVNSGVESANITGLNPSTSYDFEIYPYSNSNTNIDFKTSPAAPSQTQSTTAIPVVTLDYTFDLTAADPFANNWSQYSVSGAETWIYVNGTGAQSSLFNGGCQINEDWLISPGLNLSATSNELLSFTTAEDFSGTDLTVLYSTNYSGTGDPNSATWTTISTIASGNGGTVSNLTNLQGLATSPVYVAFRHIKSSAGGNCSRWNVASFSVIEVTGSSSSDLITSSSFTPSSDIDYTSYSAASSLTNSNAIKIAEFDLRDGGASADSDGNATTLTDLTFTVAGDANLAALALFAGDGSTNSNLAEVTSVSSSTVFSSLTIAANDDASTSLSVYATFKSSVTDNDRVQLTVSSVTADVNGSLFSAANGGGATTSTTNQENQIEVTATQLAFSVQPSNVAVNTAISPAVEVEATDANGSRDLDFTSQLSMAVTGGSFNGSATTTATPVAGLATFNNLQFSATATGVTITPSGASLSNSASSSFDVNNEVQLFLEDFEDASLNYTASATESISGSDYFSRGGAADFTGTYNNPQGSSFFGAQDIDGVTASSTQNITSNSISISGYTNLEFRVYLAEDDDGSNQDWDAADYLHVTYDIDGGGDQNLLWVEAAGGTNTEPQIDSDFDGLGNGTAITDNFTQYTAAIPGNGSSMTIKLEFSLNSGDEDIAVDHIEVYGELSSGPLGPNNVSIDALSSTTMDISWSQPSGTYGTDWDGVLVFVSDGSNGINLSPVGGDGIDFTANLAYASGTQVSDAGNNDNAYCVANQTSNAAGNITVTGLTTGSTYYVYAFAYEEVVGNNDDDNFSSEVSGGNGTTPAFATGDIVISEIMYNSSSTDDEWVELYNASGSNIDLDGSWRLSYSGNNYDFDAFTLNSGAYMTVAVGSNGDATYNNDNAFTPDLNALGVANSAVASTNNSNNLGNASETVSVIYDPSGSNITIDAVTYDDGAPWPTSADGNGPSLTLIDLASDNSLGASWRASFGNGGTPGVAAISDLIYTSGSWNVVPSSNTGTANATVRTGQSVTISADAAVNNLTIESGATLTIAADIDFTVNGDISNANSIAVESGASLVQTKTGVDNNSGAGSYSVSRQYTPFNQTRFSFWSSPVDAANTNTVFDGSNTNDIYSWTAGAQAANNWVSAANTTMNPGQGYIATPSLNAGTNYTDTRIFTGNINNGDLSISFNGVNADDWVLIGNPYPSAIDFEDFAALNTDLNATIYYWDASPTNRADAAYSNWNTTGAVAASNSQRNSPSSSVRAMQGFFVQVTSGFAGGTLTVSFENSLRQNFGNTNAGFFKTEVRERAWLGLSSDSASNQILISFDDRASLGFDRLYDAQIFKASQYHSLYSMQGTKELSTQARPYIQVGSTEVVPLGVDAWSAGLYTIGLDSLNNWDANNAIFLLDSFNNTVVDLQQNDFQFTVSQAGVIHNRFYLVFGANSSIGINEITNEQFFAYQNAKGQLVINDPQHLGLEKAQLFDVSGNLMLDAALESQLQVNQIAVESLAIGIYMIQVQDRKGRMHRNRIFIK